MPIVIPVPIPAAPAAPQRNDPTTFEERNDAAVEYQFVTLPPAINQQTEAAYQNALEAKTQAESATASAGVATGAASAASGAAGTAVAAATQTGQDRAATQADRTATDQNAQATGEDRTATQADRAAVEEMLLIAEIPPMATVEEMEDGTEVEPRSLSPSLVEASIAKISRPLNDPLLKLGGGEGVLGQVPVSQGAGLPPVWGNVGGLPIGAYVPIYNGTTDLLIENDEGSWLKSGVIAPAATYPDAPSAPAAILNSTAGAINLTGTYPAYGAGTWVIPTTDGVAVSKDNTLSWEFIPIGTPSQIRTYSRMEFVNSLFILSPYEVSDTIYTSSDGITWTARTLPESAQWTEVVFGGGTYVVGKLNTATIYYTTDLITWTAVTTGVPSITVVFGRTGRFLLGGADGKIYYSNNGIAWTNTGITSIPMGMSWKSFAYNGAAYIAYSESYYDSPNSRYENRQSVSPDGITWSSPQPSVHNNGSTNGVFINAVGSKFWLNGGTNNAYRYRIGFTSVNNGTNWDQLTNTPNQESRTFHPGNSVTGKLATNGTTYIWGGGAISYNSGVTWGSLGDNLTSQHYSTSVVYGNGLYVRLRASVDGTSGAVRPFQIAVSTDNKTYVCRAITLADKPYAEAYWTALMWTGSVWVLAGNSFYMGQLALKSTDLITWEVCSGSLPVNPIFYKAGDLFFALPRNNGTGGFIASTDTYSTSPDGVTWINRTFPNYAGQSSTNSMNPAFVVYDGANYYVIRGSFSGSAVPIYKSADGFTWTTTLTTMNQSDPSGFFYKDGVFITIFRNGKVFRSTDSTVTWVDITDTNVFGFTYAKPSVVIWAVSDGNVIIAGGYRLATDEGSAAYLISDDFTNFVWRQGSIGFKGYNDFVGGDNVYASRNMGMTIGISSDGVLGSSSGTWNVGEHYVLNDVAHYSYMTPIVAGTESRGVQLYEKVA